MFNRDGLELIVRPACNKYKISCFCLLSNFCSTKILEKKKLAVEAREKLVIEKKQEINTISWNQKQQRNIVNKSNCLIKA